MLRRTVIAVKDEALALRLEALLEIEDTVIERFRPGKGLWRRLILDSSDLVVLDPRAIPSPAHESIGELLALPDAPDVLILVEAMMSDQTAQLMSAGASGVIGIDVSDETLRETAIAFLDRRRRGVVEDLEGRHRGEKPRLSDFRLSSPTMSAFIDFVEKIVHSDSTLLVTGETGVGKEHLAHAIHSESHRSSGPFVAINCAALPETLLESELFGHEEGSFTGANRVRRGWFELSHKGTVFLDEIGELPKHLQVKLLRFLQSREIQRIGSSESIEVDVRVMAATNRDLQVEIAEKRFRLDLFYRLSVVTLELPTLRARKEDIPALARKFMRALRKRVTATARSFSPEALQLLSEYAWPGNVRELINVVERSLLLAEGEEIRPENLPAAIAHRAFGPRPGTAEPPSPERSKSWLGTPFLEARRRVLSEFEREYLSCLLKETRGHIGHAADLAGLNRRSIYEKLHRHSISKNSFKGRGAKGVD